MIKYIDILLTEKGVFCVAPPWEVSEGDLVCLENHLTGDKVVEKVIAVATDSTDGDHIMQLERYVGGPLPKIVAKYRSYSVAWEEQNVSE